MPYPLCVVSADWHLERNAWAKHPTLCGDAYYGLEQVVTYCLNEKVPLIAAGDLFNEPYPEALSVWHAAKQMERMANANLPVYFVQGQHEKTRDTPWMEAFHHWPKHVDRQSFTVCNRRFYGLDYVRGYDACKFELGKIPAGTEVLVTHQVWFDLMGQITSPEAKLSDVQNAKVVLTGDYHKHLIFRGVGAGGQSVKLVSPGPLCLQAMGEEPHKSFYILYDDMSLRSVRLHCRAFFNFAIKTPNDLSWFRAHAMEALKECNHLDERIRKPIFYVEFDEDVEDAYSVIHQTVGDKAHLFWVRRRAGRTLVQESDVKAADANTSLEECLSLFANTDTDIYEITLALLRSEDPAATLEHFAERQLGKVVCV